MIEILFDVDRSVTSDRQTQTDGQTHEHGFGEGSYTIAPKGAKNKVYAPKVLTNSLLLAQHKFPTLKNKKIEIFKIIIKHY